MHGHGASVQHSLGSGSGGRAGGDHVIDQDDGSAGQGGRGLECPCHVQHPLGLGKPHLSQRGPGPLERLGPYSTSSGPGEGPGQEPGLVVAAPPEPGHMQRDRDQLRGGQSGQPPTGGSRQRLAQRDAQLTVPLVLEAVDGPGQRALVDEGGEARGEGRPSSSASPASPPVTVRLTALWAARARDGFGGQVTPAAERPRDVQQLGAGHAGRWKDQVEESGSEPHAPIGRASCGPAPQAKSPCRSISFGWGSSITLQRVGATSASTPGRSLVPRRSGCTM
jgi:hypothetical protein